MASAYVNFTTENDPFAKISPVSRVSSSDRRLFARQIRRSLRVGNRIAAGDNCSMTNQDSRLKVSWKNTFSLRFPLLFVHFIVPATQKERSQNNAGSVIYEATSKILTLYRRHLSTLFHSHLFLFHDFFIPSEPSAPTAHISLVFLAPSYALLSYTLYHYLSLSLSPTPTLAPTLHMFSSPQTRVLFPQDFKISHPATGSLRLHNKSRETHRVNAYLRITGP